MSRCVDYQNPLPPELWANVLTRCDPTIVGRVCQLFRALVGDISCHVYTGQKLTMQFVVHRKPATQALTAASVLAHFRRTCLASLSRPIRLITLDLLSQEYREEATFEQRLAVATAQAQAQLTVARIHFDQANCYFWTMKKSYSYWGHLRRIRKHIKAGTIYQPPLVPRDRRKKGWEEWRDWEDAEIAVAQARGGLWNEALQRSAEILCDDSKEEVWENLATIAADHGDCERAIDFAMKIEHETYRIQKFCTLIKILQDQGYADAANQAFMLAITRAYDAKEKGDQVPFFLEIGCALIKARCIERALFLLRILKLYGLQDVVHRSASILQFIRELSKADVPEIALKLFLKVEKITKENGYHVNATLKEVVLSLIRARQLECALSIFTSKERSNMLFGDNRVEIINALLKEGFFSDAKSIIFSSQGKSYRPGGFWRCKRLEEVAAAEADAGGFNNALFTAFHINDPLVQVIAYGRIAAAKIRSGADVESGYELLCQATEMAKESPGTLSIIAQIHKRVGNDQRAFELFERAKNTLLLTENSTPARGNLWSDILRLEMEAHSWESARHTIELLKNLGWKEYVEAASEALTQIAAFQANSGHPLQAWQITKDIPMLKDFIDAVLAIGGATHPLALDPLLEQTVADLHKSSVGAATICDLGQLPRFSTIELSDL